MKLVNEDLKNISIMIGKEVVTVGEDGSIEVDAKDKETIQSLIASGFKEVSGKKSEKTKVAPPKEESEESEDESEDEDLADEETEEKMTETEYKSLAEKNKNKKQSNRFVRG